MLEVPIALFFGSLSTKQLTYRGAYGSNWEKKTRVPRRLRGTAGSGDVN